MKIFLTGATGLIGRHTLARALEQGHQVTALVRNRARLTQAPSDRLAIVQGDLADPESLRRDLAGHDVVINAAGLLTGGSPEEFRRANVEGPSRLYRLAREHAVGCFVHVGSMGIYALEQGTALSEETSEEPHPDRRGLYTASKLEGERALRTEAGGAPPTLVIVRPSVVYGAGLDLPMGRLAMRLPGGLALVFGSGRHPFPLTYAGNLADALLLAARRAKPGVFNIVDDPGLRHRDYHRTLRQLCPQSSRPFYVPGSLLITAARLFDLAGALAGRHRHVAYRLRRNVFPQPIDVSRAAAQLGYRPRYDLAESMTRTLNRRGA